MPAVPIMTHCKAIQPVLGRLRAPAPRVAEPQKSGNDAGTHGRWLPEWTNPSSICGLVWAGRMERKRGNLTHSRPCYGWRGSCSLEQAKSAVLNTLTSGSGQRTYDHAITEFVEWYCSEPRLAFNRTVVLRYRIHLEQKGYAPNTINLRLAAVRRVAYEACDSGVLSPELGAGIRRVKGVRRLGVRVGNWLTPAQGKLLLERSDTAT